MQQVGDLNVFERDRRIGNKRPADQKPDEVVLRSSDSQSAELLNQFRFSNKRIVFGIEFRETAFVDYPLSHK